MLQDPFLEGGWVFWRCGGRTADRTGPKRSAPITTFRDAQGYLLVMSQVARGKLDHGKLARPKLDLGKLARAKPARQKLAKLLN